MRYGVKQELSPGWSRLHESGDSVAAWLL